MGDDDPQAAVVVAERTWLYGLIRRRRNNHVDVCCVHDLSKDFLYMLLFVASIFAMLLLYVAAQ